MVPEPTESRQGDGEVSSSKLHFCRQLSLVSFRLALLFFGMGVIFVFFIVRAMGLWQLGGAKKPATDLFGMFWLGCWIIAMICNAVALIASLWGWKKGKGKSNIILWLSGIGTLASVWFLLMIGAFLLSG